MRRLMPFLCLCFVGCNAPIAAFMDTCFPSRAKANPNSGPGVDVTPQPPADPTRPGPPAGGSGPLPPPDFGSRGN